MSRKVVDVCPKPIGVYVPNNAELSLDGGKCLIELWESYRIFTWQNGVPWTNNGTEQAIGWMKMRCRTVRGYQSWQGMRDGLLMSGSGLAF